MGKASFFFIHLTINTINKHHCITTPDYVSLLTMKAAASQQPEINDTQCHHQKMPDLQ